MDMAIKRTNEKIQVIAQDRNALHAYYSFFHSSKKEITLIFAFVKKKL
jgi:hypothetical protein